jgi:hypothetical protein
VSGLIARVPANTIQLVAIDIDLARERLRLPRSAVVLRAPGFSAQPPARSLFASSIALLGTLVSLSNLAARSLEPALITSGVEAVTAGSVVDLVATTEPATRIEHELPRHGFTRQGTIWSTPDAYVAFFAGELAITSTAAAAEQAAGGAPLGSSISNAPNALVRDSTCRLS